MHNYLAANGGQVSHNTLPVLSGFAEQIAALQNTLNQPEAEPSTGKYATLGDAYADSLANGETNPFVPTMTEPIPEHSQPDIYDTVGNVAAPMSEPEPSGYTGDNSGYSGVGAGPANSDPYGETWTEEQQKHKQLYDAQIRRDSMREDMAGMPTTEDIVKLGEVDDEIKQLTQELGLGPKEYTPGVEGGWQEETKPAPYTPGVEGGDIGEIDSQGVHFGGSILDEKEDGGLLGNIADVAQDVWDSATGVAEDVWNGIKDIGEDAANQVTEATKWGVDALNTLYDMGVDVSEAAYKAVMEQINTTGDALEAVKDVVVNEFNSAVNKAMEDLQDAMVEKESEFHKFAFNNSRGAELVKELSNALLIKLEGGWKLFDSTEEKLGHKYVSEKEYNESENPDEKLEWNRTWSERVDELSADSNFNTSGIINHQPSLGSETFGSQGNAADNCCGTISVQNALVCMGKNSYFPEVYATFDDDDMLLNNGTYGTNPAAVIEYIEKEGLEVTPVLPSPQTIAEPGVSIYVYMWEDNGARNFHYMTVESDGKGLQTYNFDKYYDISSVDIEDSSTYGAIVDFAEKEDMVMWMQLKIE